MFFTLLAITLSLSVTVAYTAARVFRRPIAPFSDVLSRMKISSAWQRYVMFATYVVGISAGVRIYDLERYISPQFQDMEILQLNAERWVLEIYRTLIACLQGIAWMYLVVFVVALLAYVIVRGFELKRGAAD